MFLQGPVDNKFQVYKIVRIQINVRGNKKKIKFKAETKMFISHVCMQI